MTPEAVILVVCGVALLLATAFVIEKNAPPVTAAKNLKDPEKVKADIEQRTKDRDDVCGLDYVAALAAWWLP